MQGRSQLNDRDFYVVQNVVMRGNILWSPLRFSGPIALPILLGFPIVGELAANCKSLRSDELLACRIEFDRRVDGELHTTSAGRRLMVALMRLIL